MPFQSESQRRFLWLKHPEVAKKWAKEFPNQKDLPKHKRQKRNKHSHLYD